MQRTEPAMHILLFTATLTENIVYGLYTMILEHCLFLPTMQRLVELEILLLLPFLSLPLHLPIERMIVCSYLLSLPVFMIFHNSFAIQFLLFCSFSHFLPIYLKKKRKKEFRHARLSHQRRITWSWLNPVADQCVGSGRENMPLHLPGGRKHS